MNMPAPYRYTLLTYATDKFKGNANHLVESALRVGFDKGIVASPESITNTDFYDQNREILEQKRGGGYWLWKPYIIQNAIQRAAPNEIIFYSDAGRTDYYSFTKFPKNLVEKFIKHGEGLLLGTACPQFGPLKKWTKADCFKIMNADDSIKSNPLLMTWGLWSNSEKANCFLKQWIKYGSDKRCVTDLPSEMPNDPMFIDHRHDQSIFSILAYQLNTPYTDFTDTIIQSLLNKYSGSVLAQQFYKRPLNADNMLKSANPFQLVQEFLRVKQQKTLV